MKNWKTTVAGIATVLSGVGLCLTGHVAEGVAAITAGLGLLFAHDAPTAA